MPSKVLVCQYQTCTQQGAAQVLAAFQAQAPAQVQVERSGCLGQCGSGPMVLVLPDETWYCRIQSSDVPLIVAQHLQAGQVVSHKLYPAFHPNRKSVIIWLSACGVVIGLLTLFMWFLASQTYYF